MQARNRLIHKALASLQVIHGEGDLDAAELNSSVAFITMQLAMIESEAALPEPVRLVPLLTLGDINAAAAAIAKSRPSLVIIEGGNQ